MSLVTVTREGGVVTFTVANPPLNILTCAAMKELQGACGGLLPGDRILVIRGAGRHFSAGADVGEHLPAQAPLLLETLHSCFRALHDVPIPTLAVARGACLGAGLELAAACDLMLAADEAKLGVPEITLGVFPPIAAVDLPGKIGAARAAELVMSGRTIDGRTAAAWGLASESVPDGELDARVAAFVGRIAAFSGAALRSAKRGLRAAAAAADHGAALAAAIGVYRDGVLPSADGLEGLQAFLGKRAAVWTDR